MTVAYTNSVGYNYGYTITTPNGDTIRRIVERDDFNPSLVTNCVTHFNSSLIDSTVYTFDALFRPTDRIASRAGCQPVQSSFAYNDRNGASNVYEEWADGRWKHTAQTGSYGANGCRIDTTTIMASDHAAVTAQTIYRDFLGRMVREVRPTSDVTYTYDGASPRVLSATDSMSGETVTRLYNDLGEAVGQVKNGVTNRTDTTYEVSSNVLWRVTTQITAGGTRSVASVTQERLAGLSDGLRSETFEYRNGALALHAYSSFNPTNAILIEVSESATSGTTTTKSKYGVVIETTTSAGTTTNFFDPYGRVFYTEKDGRSVDWIGRNDYGDVEEYDTFHSEGNAYYAEFYGYDSFGNRIIATNALGAVTYSAYDAANRLVESGGATYPVRNGYDTDGRRTSLTTFRDAGGPGSVPAADGDTTTWTFDPATGFCTVKTYADNSANAYTYTSDGKPLRTTYASGRWRENAYNAKRELASVEYSDGDVSSFAYDEFSHEIAASNSVAFVQLLRNDYGQVTNETATVGSESRTVEREFDALGRLTGNDGSTYEYASDGRIASISNALANVEYLYTTDRLDAGYVLTLSNGLVFTRSLMRDAYRRSLVTDITNSVNGIDVETFSYAYDALGRPTSRNADTFSYNDRSEVTSATIGGNYETHEYDSIGNSIIASFNGATNTYSANNLNQYTMVGRVVPNAPPCSVVPTYDLDGNLLSDGVMSFTYDAANRLKTVSTNGVQILVNFYDAKSRRVKKVTSEATTTFFYDDWNLIEERVAYTNGTSSTIHYYWGKDLSGDLQGAGGVGGLLYLTVNGTIYIPCYDNNGNITRYLDANGNTVAQYTYDAFGNIISKSGPLADFFRHRFSTKYFDAETDLYYYGYRFYHPILMRWLNRDPLEEDGGLNLYVFCENIVILMVDYLGNVPTGTTFLNAYTPYNYSHGPKEIWRAVGGSLKEYFWSDETKRAPNTCATRISIALIKSNEQVANRSKQFINTVKKGEQGIPGNYIVNAAKMQDYLTMAWGTSSILSPTRAYYFKSKAKSLDIAKLREEIEEKLKCSNVSKDKYVCVVSTKVNGGSRFSGHIGVVTKTYDDGETPFEDNPVVWILPPTKILTPKKK